MFSQGSPENIIVSSFALLYGNNNYKRHIALIHQLMVYQDVMDL